MLLIVSLKPHYEHWRQKYWVGKPK